MQTLTQASLAPFHTFSIEQTCDYLMEVSSIDELKAAFQNPEWLTIPKLVLGKGSNMLFTQHFEGVVLLNRLLGKSVEESETHWKLHISAGEDWPSFVQWCVEKGYNGLENLALIPGCVGSAPIQNIGAYGVELQDVCEYVDVLCLESYQIIRLNAEECEFGYRDSVFKHRLYQKAVIVAVGFSLSKSWNASVQYGPLKSFKQDTVTAREVFERVCQTRQDKLPDPSVNGNAGSFFKNPIVGESHYQRLAQQYPDIVAYPVANGTKLAAGWLIDQCGLKGEMCGGAQVHPKQALVIVNKSQAIAEDVVSLAALVRQRVLDKFGVELEHEVRFMGATHETSLERILGKLL